MLSLITWAQPGNLKNTAKSMFNITTYDAQGAICTVAKGVFTSTDGKAIAPWSALAHAQHATITTIDGATYNVQSIIGISELYDVCHITTTATATTPVTFATSPATKGQQLWLLGIQGKKYIATPYVVDRAEPFMEHYTYYVFEYNAASATIGQPLINDKGQVAALYQQSSSSLYGKGVDASFAASLMAQPFDINNSAYAHTSLRLAIPANRKDAQLMSMLAASLPDTTKQAGYISDYIAAFPTEVDGYATSAMIHLSANRFAAADYTMQQCLKHATDKAEAHSEYARIMQQKLLYNADTTYNAWTLDRALDEATTAVKINALPSYRHRQAQLLYAKGCYRQALDILDNLLSGSLHTSEVFYEAAQCHTMLGNSSDIIVALLDSAVTACHQPLSAIDAPYILARGRLHHDMGNYRLALVDYNRYDTLMQGRADAQFYYTRYLCETKLHQWQQAINDIAHAAWLQPGNDAMLAELASLQLRVGKHADAITTAEMCLKANANNTDAIIIKGIALIFGKHKAEGMALLEQAKKLGDTRADDYIKKYK